MREVDDAPRLQESLGGHQVVQQAVVVGGGGQVLPQHRQGQHPKGHYGGQRSPGMETAYYVAPGGALTGRGEEGPTREQEGQGEGRRQEEHQGRGE